MSNSNLKTISFFQGLDRRQVAQVAQDKHQALLYRFRYLPSLTLLNISDKIGAHWLQRNQSLYKTETLQLAQLLGAGIFTLNTGFEWGCTTYIRHDPITGQPLMHRVLDWSMPLGPFAFVAEYNTAHGAYHDINWAGNSGILNAIALNRFSAAINQAPIPMHSGLGQAGFLIDWAIQRYKTWHSNAWPPSHLLRHVFESAPNFTTAKQMLTETPLAIPVIFTLCGTQPGEACVIERLENSAYIIDSDAICTANHWQNPAWRGHPRPIKSAARLTAAQQATQTHTVDWLQAPLLNKHTVLALHTKPDNGFSLYVYDQVNGHIKPYAFFDL